MSTKEQIRELIWGNRNNILHKYNEQDATERVHLRMAKYNDRYGLNVNPKDVIILGDNFFFTSDSFYYRSNDSVATIKFSDIEEIISTDTDGLEFHLREPKQVVVVKAENLIPDKVYELIAQIVKIINDPDQHGEQEQPGCSAKSIIILLIALIATVSIVVIIAQCTQYNKRKSNTEYYRERVQSIIDDLSIAGPKEFTDLKSLQGELESLEITMRDKPLDYDEINVQGAQKAIQNHETIKEKGIVSLEWSTDKEISRDTEKSIETFKNFTGNSIHYKYIPNDYIEKKAVALYEKYYWPKNECMAVAQNQVFIGMSEQQLVASKGKPRNVNRTSTAWSITEQWVYGSFGPFIYLENGVVTAVQD